MNQVAKKLELIGLDQRFAVDVLSVAKKVRKIGLLHAPTEMEPSLKELLGSLDLKVFAQRDLVREDDPNSREGVLRDTRSGEVPNFSELWFARNTDHDLPQTPALFSDTGKFLSYPRCCTAEWERLKSQRDLYQRYVCDTEGGNWETNRLATLFQPNLLFPDFFPCSLSCESARLFSKSMITVAKLYLDPDWVHETTRWMRAPLLENGSELYAFPTWRLIDGVLELSSRDAAKITFGKIAQFTKIHDKKLKLISFKHLDQARKVTLFHSNSTQILLE